MTGRTADTRFDELAEAALRATWEFYPNLAARLGLHDYDGRLPDISSQSLARRARDVEEAVTSLQQLNLGALSRDLRFDCRILVSALKLELLHLTELRSYATNPMHMLWHIDLSNYAMRDYAPLGKRVEALIAALQGVPAIVAAMRSGLDARLGRPILESSIQAYEGMARFYDAELPEAVRLGIDEARVGLFDETRGAASHAVTEFVGYLTGLRERATDDFAIGAESLQKMLARGDMADTPLDRLIDIGQADLERNLDRFREAARRIDRSRSPAEVMTEVSHSHPSASALIGDTQSSVERIRRFLAAGDIVTLPSGERCQTMETPPFMRWATAAMDLPGPFEATTRQAFYYVTPVEPHWTDEQAEEWLSIFNYPALQTMSIHEVYPGHFVHYLHSRNVSSNVRKVFQSYSFVEGWAHYAEEMMMEQGYGGGDAHILLGQLSDALLRNCRFICSIRMHTQGMTLDQATRFFVERAYIGELPARKEAMRGTFDPLYLSYTLGKLMIQKLREDCRSEQGQSFSLRGFHDRLLSFGAPPIPLLREEMLRGGDSHVL